MDPNDRNITLINYYWKRLLQPRVNLDNQQITPEHRGYAVVHLSPVIEAVGVTSTTPTQEKKTMGNFQFSSAHNIILKATSPTYYH